MVQKYVMRVELQDSKKNFHEFSDYNKTMLQLYNCQFSILCLTNKQNLPSTLAQQKMSIFYT
jgi:hypothetical protein